MSLDLLRARVAFRDRSFADVLDLSLRFIVAQGLSYAKVALASLVPLLLVALAAGKFLGWTTSWAIAIPLSIAAEIPFTVLASRLVFQDEVCARDVLRAALRDSTKLLFARAVAIVLSAFGLMFFIVPAFWILAISLFLGEVMLLERAGLGQTISRSQRVASCALSEVLLGVIVFGLVPIASVFVVDMTGRALVGELLQFRPPRPVWEQGGSFLATLGLFAQVPYLATARFFLYLNVRTRAEGWDIQTRFAAIAARRDEAAG